MINPYQAAVDRELISCHLGTANDDDGDTVAGEKLSQVIDWHVSVATDPKVNGGYHLVHKDVLVVTDNTEVISYLNRQVEYLKEQLHHTRYELIDVLDQVDAARARGDYWQGVAQGDIPEDS